MKEQHIENEMPLEEWMIQAKKYARKDHNITFKDDDEFRDLVKSYWGCNVVPEIAVKHAIKIISA